MNTTTFAIDKLGLSVTAPTQPLALENAVGIALRHNPKRAHLLVSKLLGKHTPQRPDIVDAAARILAVRTCDTAAGRADRAQSLLGQLNTALSDGTPAPAAPQCPTSNVLVVGFAEAATALGAVFAQHLGAYYVCSTRTPQAAVYGEFLEAHSHAANHFLTPSDAAYLDDADRPVVLVDDELTTGRTAMNTIRALHARAAHPSYVIATLADLRTDDARAAMTAFAEEIGVPVSVVSLFSASITVPEDAIERAADIIAAAPAQAPVARALTTEHVQRPFTYSRPVNARDGIPDHQGLVAAATGLARSARPTAGERVLVLGVEEDMTLALETARLMGEAGHDVHFSSTTRSPAALIHANGYPITDAISFDGPGGAPRFIYNIDGHYDHVIIVSTDALYADTLPAIAAALDGHVSKVTIAAARSLAAPLTGPEFGSYDAADVQWLLKDLSGVALEVSLEDREELVQSGAHYAESLPQEYQPSDDYMELFWNALDENAGRVADDIAVVAHRIMAARSGRPVLVSLARAGTPVGVLLRRYMGEFFGYDAPHYAVSIVRGKGIDTNALAYIAEHHRAEDVIFVDGWTGKGAITAELRDALLAHAERTGVQFSAELAVLADTGDCTTIYGTRDDYLIPSAALNSTVSGLVSRTVLNDDLIGESDYHGAKFYAELIGADVSGRFIDEVSAHFTAIDPAQVPAAGAPGWASWAEVERLSTAYGIGAVNLVKPGVGETTRVLLRRVPWRVLLNPDAADAVAHIRALAEARGVFIEEVPGLRFNAVGLIHPNFTKSATGADGLAAAREVAA
jgi:orotate phosphoribosyltransferase-like protein